MQRWITIILGLGVVALVVAMTAKSAPVASPAQAHAHTSADALDASPDAADAASTADTGLRLDLEERDAAFILLSDLPADLPADAGSTLPPGTPRQVRFGVVLVQYAGVEDAPSKARSKSDARI